MEVKGGRMDYRYLSCQRSMLKVFSANYFHWTAHGVVFDNELILLNWLLTLHGLFPKDTEKLYSSITMKTGVERLCISTLKGIGAYRKKIMVMLMASQTASTRTQAASLHTKFKCTAIYDPYKYFSNPVFGT